MQTIVLYLCYIVLVLLFSTAYVFNILFWIRCLHTDKRRPSSTLSGHSSSSFYFSFAIWVSGCQTRQQHCCFCNGRWLRSKWLVLGLKWGSQFRMSCHHPELGTWLRTPWGVDCTVLATADWQASEQTMKSQSPFTCKENLPNIKWQMRALEQSDTGFRSAVAVRLLRLSMSTQRGGLFRPCVRLGSCLRSVFKFWLFKWGGLSGSCFSQALAASGKLLPAVKAALACFAAVPTSHFEAALHT